jgi:hypothetical protein
MGIIKNIGLGLSGILYLLLAIAGVVLHLYTVLIAFFEKGFLAALITFVFPVGSQIYWVAYWTGRLGTFLNTYTYLVLGYGLAWLIVIILLGIFSPKEV